MKDKYNIILRFKKNFKWSLKQTLKDLPWILLISLLFVLLKYSNIDLRSLFLTNVYAANSWGALISEPEEMYIQHTLTSDPIICTDYQNTSYLCTMPSGNTSEIFSWIVPRLKYGRSYTAYVDACYNQNVTSSNGGAFINGSNTAFANLQGGTITLNGAPSGSNFTNGCYRYWVNFDTNAINHTEFSYDIFQIRISKGSGAINMYVYDFGLIDNGLGGTALTGINNNINNSIATVNNNINNVTNNINNSMEEVNNSIQEQIGVNQEQLEEQKQTNNLLNDDSIDENGKADLFKLRGFDDFINAFTGLLSIPIQFMRKINNSTCSPIILEVPFINENNIIELPCYSTIMSNKFGVFYSIYKIIINFIIAYHLGIAYLDLFKSTLNPKNDKLEVMDL